jgi:hypothetical protein
MREREKESLMRKRSKHESETNLNDISKLSEKNLNEREAKQKRERYIVQCVVHKP